ncbi:hypothetical protein [Clostridium sp. BSD9I1]|uniref:hypothetical protein n=1 Tax=Clostridium sp. BSD9I1 TaxID=2003589 RepID=UPI00164755A4|nr:hypothetical protein [Clostridium sp. BSD9I1]
MTNCRKLPLLSSWEATAATSMDNEFLASAGVKTPSEAKNSVYQNKYYGKGNFGEDKGNRRA